MLVTTSGMLAVAVLLQGRIRHPAEARRHDHRPDLQGDVLGLLAEVDGVAAADRYADLAGVVLDVQAGLGIDVIGGRHRLRIIDVDGPGDVQPLVVGIDQMPRAVGGAKPAGRALVGVDVTGPQLQLGLEFTGFARQGQ